MELEKASHGVYKIRYHIVLVVKYRKLIIREEIRKEIAKILKEISERFEIKYGSSPN
jgi:REP element-mobilizing transposase RayT